MTDTHFKVLVEGDHIKKLAAARPVQAVAELVWNSLDAEATRVDVEMETSNFTTPTIRVSDNGHGIPHDEIKEAFGKLGGSWKAKSNRSKVKSRFLHGKEGQGRFKALALGRVVDWQIRYFDSGNLLSYKVSIIRDDPSDVIISEPAKIEQSYGSGVDVTISELDRAYRSLEPDVALQSFSEILALYLNDYHDVKIFVSGNQLDPESAILSRGKFDLSPIVRGEESYPTSLEVIEWKTTSERLLFLCGEEGFPFHRIPLRMHTPGFQHSSYLKSDFISLLQTEGTLELAEMNESLNAVVEEATAKIKEYFRAKETSLALSEIEQWKAEKIYPYVSEPKTTVEHAERQVFEIVALNVKKHLDDFSGQTKKNKAFQLQLLRQAVEGGPDELQHILKEVLDLPENTLKELSKLLEEANLSNIISASKLVTDRLKFVHGLEALIFDTDTKKTLKERSQLHRIIADNNTWLFGEEFSLAVDDQSLTEVLKKHNSLIGKDTKIDVPVRRIDGKIGVIDLMLSKSIPRSHADEFEHLIVELKRPSVKIGSDEITQIKKYAFTISADEQFRHLDTRWNFWVVSNDLDAFAQQEAKQKDKPRGQIYQSEDGKVVVWIKSWAEIVASAKARMQFVQKHLQAKVDRESSLDYLKKTYAKYVAGVIDDSEGQEDEDAA